MSSGQRLVEFRSVRKRMNSTMAIDVDRLEIFRAECVMLRGSNGAGKSTLLKICAGLIAPDAAVVTTDGAPTNWRSAYRRFRKNVVYLHQTPYLFDRTVTENLFYGLTVRGVSRKAASRKVAEALDWSGLSSLARRNARELSGGERQRVALTRARIVSPELLLLDEPTAGMDRGARDQTFKLINTLVGEGIAVYLAMHESSPDVAFHRIMEIQRGRIVSTDDCAHV